MAADAAAVGLHLWLGSRLAAVFGAARPGPASLRSLLLFTGSYALFLVGVAWLRRGQPRDNFGLSANRRWLAAQGITLAAVVAAILADLSGFLATMFSVDFGDLGESYYFLITPAVFVVAGLLYWLLIGAQNAPKVLPAAMATIRRGLAGLLGVNGFLVVTAVFLESLWNVSNLTPGMRFGASGLLLGWLFVLPRQLFVARNGARSAWLSWGAMILYLAIQAAQVG